MIRVLPFLKYALIYSFTRVVIIEIIIKLLIEGLISLLIELKDVYIQLRGLKTFLSVVFIICLADFRVHLFQEKRVVLVLGALYILAGGVSTDFVGDCVELVIFAGRFHEVA